MIRRIPFTENLLSSGIVLDALYPLSLILTTTLYDPTLWVWKLGLKGYVTCSKSQLVCEEEVFIFRLNITRNLYIYFFLIVLPPSMLYSSLYKRTQGLQQMKWLTQKHYSLRTHLSCISILRLCKKFPPKARQSTGVSTAWIHPAVTRQNQTQKRIFLLLDISIAHSAQTQLLRAASLAVIQNTLSFSDSEHSRFLHFSNTHPSQVCHHYNPELDQLKGLINSYFSPLHFKISLLSYPSSLLSKNIITSLHDYPF